MKQFFSTIVLLFVMSASLSAQPLTSPDGLSQGCEAKRMRVVPYATKELAQQYVSEAVESQYVRPIAEWQRSEDADAVVFTSSYVIPFSWLSRQALIYVEWATSAYEVLINGKKIGYNTNGYAPAEFNITKSSKEEHNTISIRLLKDHWCESLESFDEGAEPALGEVFVLSQPTIRVRNMVSDTELDATGEYANVEVGLVVKTESLNAKRARIHYELVAADTTVVTYGHRDVELQMRGQDTVKFMARIPRSELWSADNPVRYRVNVMTQIEGRKVEYQSHWVGFRTVAYDKQTGLMINGKPTTLKYYGAKTGVSKDELLEARDKGCNAVRFNSPAVTQRDYRLCEELGMYVVAQLPIDTSRSGDSRLVDGNESNNPEWTAAFIERADATWRTTGGFACVVGYSLAGDSANGICLYESYLHLKSLEHKRPIIYPAAAGEWNNDGDF
ncbi:MAG: hypothetical protein J6L75_04750 [Alistipes sp.]|nr:hypothetical protein [Alistipes sp.]